MFVKLDLHIDSLPAKSFIHVKRRFLKPTYLGVDVDLGVDFIKCLLLLLIFIIKTTI